MRTGRADRFTGFSLLEVVIAMTILAMLTGSIYGLMRQTLRSGAEVELAEREDRAVYRFIDLCRDMFLTLPGEATLSCPLPQDGTTAQEFVLTGVPEAFRVGEPVTAGETLMFGLRPYELPSGEVPPVPVQVVSVSRDGFAPDVEEGMFAAGTSDEEGFYLPDEQGRYWLPLLPGIERFQWRFWNVTEERWEEEWKDETNRPPLIELWVQPYGRGYPYRAVFEVPPLAVTEDLLLPEVAPAAGGAGGPGSGGGGRPPGDGGGQGQRPGPGQPGDGGRPGGPRGPGGGPGQGPGGQSPGGPRPGGPGGTGGESSGNARPGGPAQGPGTGGD